MANVILNEEHLTNIANAIRTKKGSVNKMTPSQMANEISSIDSGGLDTNDATAIAGDILYRKTAYVKGIKLTGTMENLGAQNITINNLDDNHIPQGYHNGLGTIKINSTDKSKLIPENIKSGVSILGVNGSLQTGPSGENTSDATAYSEHLLTGKTAYARGQKITGSMADNTGKNVTISQKYGVNKIPKGYYNGESTVDLDTTSFNNIISDNIKKGVTILGITGTYTGSGGSSSSGGSQIKTGTTQSPNIYTGLSSIDKFILYSDKITDQGLVNAIYEKSRSQATVTVCGSYNNYVQQCKTEVKTTGYSVSGGTFSWTDNSALGSFMPSATYNWIAIGI